MPLQKSQIVETALNILDRDGLEGVTLRRLGSELNVKAASIYWHIPNKYTLLDEMANAILEKRFGTFDFANDDRDWAEWLDTLAHELRAAMLAHREGARVVAGAHPDVAFMLVKLWDVTIRVLHKAGFSYGKAATITMTMINFTFGSVIEEQASPSSFDPGPDEPLQAMQSLLDTYQTMDRVMKEWVNENDDIHFNTSVRIIINGVRIELEAGNTGSQVAE